MSQKTIIKKNPGTLIPEIVQKNDATQHDWQTARQMLQAVHTHGRLFLLGQILLGWQLQNLKKSLGFSHGGTRKKASAHDEHLKERTWSEWLQNELSLARPTADRFIQVHLGAKAKLKRLGGSSKALRLLSKSPQDITTPEKQLLEKQLTKVTDGDTQKDLLIELKLVKAPQGSALTGGKKDTEKQKVQPTMKQLSLILFGETFDSIINLRTHGDYKKCLHALDVTSDDETEITLNTLEQQTTALLHEIQKAKTKALK